MGAGGVAAGRTVKVRGGRRTGKVYNIAMIRQGRMRPTNHHHPKSYPMEVLPKKISIPATGTLNQPSARLLLSTPRRLRHSATQPLSHSATRSPRLHSRPSRVSVLISPTRKPVVLVSLSPVTGGLDGRLTALLRIGLLPILREAWTYRLRPYMRSKDLTWCHSLPSPIDAVPRACQQALEPLPENYDE